MRLKDFSKLNPLYSGKAIHGDISFVPMESLRNDSIDLQTIPYDQGIGKYNYFANGDLLIAKVTPCFENGNIAIADNLLNGIGVGSSEIFVLRFNQRKALNRYMFYVSETNDFQGKGCATMHGVGGLRRIDPLFMRTYEVDIPSLPVQRRIVSYLDSKTSEIDQAISLLEQKREAYTRLKASVINRAVTRGLNPNVKLKDSGVEWIGRIPEEWKTRRIKEVGKLVLGKMLTEKPRPGMKLCKYLKSKNIGYLTLSLDEIEEMYFSDSEFEILKLHKGDLVFSEGGEVGKTAIWKDDVKDCCIQNSVHKLTVNKGYDPKYYLYLSYMFGKTGYYKSIVNLVSIMHLTYEKLRRVTVLVPPLSEQRSIASYLDAECSKIDRAASIVEKEIDAYKRLKRSLINEVVTGKRKVE